MTLTVAWILIVLVILSALGAIGSSIEEIKLRKFGFKSFRNLAWGILVLVSAYFVVPYFWDMSWGAKAYFNEGMEYFQNNDYQNAIKKWKVASEKGHHGAEFNIAITYEKGGYGIDKDYKEAFKWYNMAAEGGLIEAQFNLAIVYFEGQGIQRDTDKCIYWARKAAQQGSQKAKDFLEDYFGIYSDDN